MSAAISMEEGAELFRQALRGEIPVRLDDNQDRTWEDQYCGDVGFRFGDWTVWFFNDCNELDYTDCIHAPDGRRADFDQWCEGDFIGCPLSLLTKQEHADLERLLEQVA